MAGTSLTQRPLVAFEVMSIGVVAGVEVKRCSVDESTQGVGAGEHWGRSVLVTEGTSPGAEIWYFRYGEAGSSRCRGAGKCTGSYLALGRTL